MNLHVRGNYSENTKRAMSQITERDIGFDMIESLLQYIKTLNKVGAVLVFLPGWNVIFMLMRHLKQHPRFG